MKISLDMLQKEGFLPQQLLLYSKLNLHNVDLDNKEIEIYDFNHIEYLKLLAEKFKLTMNIKYSDLNEDDMFFKYENGLLTYYENGQEYYETYTYINRLLVERADSEGCKIYYKYNEHNLLTVQETNNKNSLECILFIYDDDNILVNVIKQNDLFHKLTLLHEIKDI